jgi:hypothetical protein
MLTTATLTEIVSKTRRGAAVVYLAVASVLMALPKPAQALVVSTNWAGDSFIYNEKLTYCFKSSTIKLGTTVVNPVDAAIQRAANVWSALSNKFKRIGEGSGSDCSTANPSVSFVVIVIKPSNDVGAVSLTDQLNFGGQSFLPGAKTDEHRLYINAKFATPPINLENLNSIMVHEIGHILGFRHEFARPGKVCKNPMFANESTQNTNALTVYDPDSVMNYRLCSLVTIPLDTLSNLDEAGIKYLLNTELTQLSQLALWNGDFWGVPGQNCESKQGGMMANPL